MDAAVAILNRIKSLYPHTYVELQHHGKEEDDEIVKQLLELADKTDTGTIITSDSHYTNADNNQHMT